MNRESITLGRKLISLVLCAYILFISLDFVQLVTFESTKNVSSIVNSMEEDENLKRMDDDLLFFYQNFLNSEHTSDKNSGSLNLYAYIYDEIASYDPEIIPPPPKK